MQYIPLDATRKEIRLLRLTRPTGPQPSGSVAVYGTLDHASRDKENDYVALSYSWGDPTDQTMISINNTLVAVGTNLEAALRSLSAEKDGILVWADQICINQSDAREKELQVQQMRSIFTEATQVVAWIGPAADDSDMIVSSLKSLAKLHMDVKFVERFSDDDLVLPTQHAFHAFCRRGYWSRLWVIQEVAVGRSVTFACGAARIHYTALNYAVVNIGRLGKLKEQQSGISGQMAKAWHNVMRAFDSWALSFIEGIFAARNRYQRESADERDPLFQVLVTSTVLEMDYNFPQCTDPRDRVFSILGLARDAPEFSSLPDYVRSCEEVYKTVARKFLEQGHIDMLSYCQFPKQTDMPTWTPDWRTHVRSPTANAPWFRKFSASNSRKQIKVEFQGPETVTLDGILVDTVAEFGAPWDPNWLAPFDREAGRAFLRDINAFCTKSPHLRDAVEVNTAKIAVAGFRYFGNSDHNGWKDCYRHMIQMFNTPDPNSGSVGVNNMGRLLEIKATRFDDFLWGVKRLHSRRPFISSSGLVGLAPLHVEAGDVICIFLGGETPYTIRSREEGAHSLVGETYVHGIMHGEWMTPERETRPFVLR